MNFDFTNSFYGNQENDYQSPGRRRFPFIFGQQAQPDPQELSIPVADYYRQYAALGGQFPGYSNIENLYTPEDATRLREITTKDSGASRILEDYYSSMPTEDQFKPGIGRRIAGFLLGTLGRTGYTGAQNYIHEPYDDAIKEWQLQGPGAIQAAKNAEAAQNRELAGFKVEAGARAGQARLNSTNLGRNNALASGIVSRAGALNQGQQRIDETAENNAARQLDADQARELRGIALENARAEQAARISDRARLDEIRKADLEKKQTELEEHKRETAVAKAEEFVMTLMDRHPQIYGNRNQVFGPDGEFLPNLTPEQRIRYADLIKSYAQKFYKGELK